MTFLINIVSDISLWYLLIAVPLFLFISFTFYKNDLNLNEMPVAVQKICQILRAITLILIFLLILSPLFKWFITEIKKPLIVVAIDQSQSISLSKDHLYQKQKINEFIKHLKEKNENTYNIQFLGFGSEIKPIDSLLFNHTHTNLSELLQYISNHYEFENLCALLLLTDGNFNTGQHPLYLNQKLNFPVYTIPLGDTTTKKDIYIEKLIYNTQQYLGNNIRIQVNLKANNYSGAKTTVRLLKNNVLLESKPVFINSNKYYQSISFNLYEERPGIYKYTIVVDSLPQEYTTTNNQKTAIINVSSDKQYIAIISSFPHPDIGAFASALQSNPAFEISLLTPEKALDSLNKYHALVLYQLPNQQNNASQLIKSLSDKQIPTLFILGSQSNLNQLNQWFYHPVVIQPKSGQFEDAYINLNVPENLFNLTNEIKETFELFPPLVVPFGNYNLPANAEIIAYQRIKQIQTNRPLIAFCEWQNNAKCGIVFGEGFYRWRMYEYLHKQQHTYVNIFLNKLIQYLLAKQKKERFIVHSQVVYNENDPIRIEAELYNKIYEPISEANISFTLVASNNHRYQFSFDKNYPFYELIINGIPADEYKWKAQAEINNEKFSKEGLFVVQQVNLEQQDYVTNIPLLQQLAIRTKGKYVPLDSLNKLPSFLENNPNIVSTSLSTENFASLIDFKWILLLIVLFISTEWFLRRYFGSL